MVDTCCDPTPIDYVIPANDDDGKAIDVILGALCQAIQEGLEERKLEKDKETDETEEVVKPAPRKLRSRREARKVDVEAAPEAEKAEAPAEKAEETPAE